MTKSKGCVWVISSRVRLFLSSGQIIFPNQGLSKSLTAIFLLYLSNLRLTGLVTSGNRKSYYGIWTSSKHDWLRATWNTCAGDMMRENGPSSTSSYTELEKVKDGKRHVQSEHK